MNKDILEDLFDSMPIEAPSANFANNLIQKIEKKAVEAEKRESRWMLFSIIVASLGLIAMAIYSYIYIMGGTFSLPKIDLPSLKPEIDLTNLKVENQLRLENFKFPAFISSLGLILLFADHYLRQYLRKKMNF